jgi:nucleoid-associated protein YgaU
LVAVSLLALGCETNKPQDEEQTSMVDMRYDTLAPPSESAESYESYDYDDATAEGTAAADGAATPDVRASGMQGEVYVVKPKDTLYSIARARYNGDHTKWKLIYEANRERISDPNRIYVGMKLIIPPDTVQ